MGLNHCANRQPLSSSTAGFTLLETMIVVSIIGILSTIAAPNWLNFINRQRLNTGQSQVYQAMQETKSNAMHQKVTWQFSVREISIKGKTTVQWAIHPESVNPTAANWQSLAPQLQLDAPETTLYTDKKNGVQRVQFNYIGNTDGQLGQITLTTKNSRKLKRCVYVSTLIGTLRTGKEHRKQNNSKKSCY
jgi:prepilin-type N-terminal cleavage/methylation domain-containing protein